MPQVILNPVIAMLKGADKMIVAARFNLIYILKTNLLIVYTPAGMILDIQRISPSIKHEAFRRMTQLAKHGALPHNGSYEVGRLIPNKPIAAVDFDSVLYSNTSGWLGVTQLPDEPSPAGMETLERLNEIGFRVVIVSCRIGRRNGLEHIQKWMRKHKLVKPYIEYSTLIPPASVYISKNSLTFRKVPPVRSFLQDIYDEFQAAKDANTPGRAVL